METIIQIYGRSLIITKEQHGIIYEKIETRVTKEQLAALSKLFIDALNDKNGKVKIP